MDHMRTMRRTGVLEGLAAGAAGGIAGAVAMVVCNHLLAAAGIGRDDYGRHHQERRLDAKPNDTDGTISDEPATMKAASSVAEAMTGRPLDDSARSVAGPVAHHLFGALVGALYGAAAARVPALGAYGGVPYGMFVWAAAAEAGLPLTGLAREPAAYPLSRHAASLATHVVFGATVETVRRAAARR